MSCSCYLRVYGKDFDVDAYLAEHPCEVSGLYRRCEPKFKKKPEGPKLEYSGFNICVSDAKFEELELQIKDALAFLQDEDNAKKVSGLVSYPGVEGVYLDFGVAWEDRDEFPVKWYHFPPELLKLAGDLGVGLEISFY